MQASPDDTAWTAEPALRSGVPGTALFTDRYELTMLQAALADGTAHRQCSFEVFTRRLPAGRRFGVVAGTSRLLDGIEAFRFTRQQIESLQGAGVIDETCADYLAGYRFQGEVDGYLEGEPYFPQSPILTVTGTFAQCVLLETLVLSVLNHDCAIAAGAARMAIAAEDRPLIEMGSRRTHEEAAVASARAAYLVGFASTSNLAAGQRFGIPTAGTAAHAFTLVHDSEAAAFAAQVAALGTSTTLLVDTYDITSGISTAVQVAGTALGAVRIDSGDLGVLARRARVQLDELGALGTAVVLSGDLDEYSIAALAAAPVNSYGVGTSVVTGSGAPTAGLVYKLVQVDGRPVAKRSENKQSQGGRKWAYRSHRESGTAISEHLVVGDRSVTLSPGDRKLTTALMTDGRPLARPTLQQSREHHRRAVQALPWEALKLSAGDSGLPVATEQTTAGD